MAFWLIKSEPDVWSWQDQVAAGAAGTHWDGVRNHVAKKHLEAMRCGDLALFYHSNHGKEIVGIVDILREAYPDPSDETGRFVMVDVRAVKAMSKPVSLATIKAVPELQEMALVKFMRLSVQPVTQAEWSLILRMGETSL